MVFFFKDCQFTVDFTSKHFPYKRKQEIRRRIIDHGGTISYILNEKTKFFVSENKEITESYKGRTALKLGIPIILFSFIDDCTKQQKLLDSDEYLLVGKSTAKQFSSGIIKANVAKPSGAKAKPPKPLSLATLKSTRVYLYNQENEALFPKDDYEIIKYAWFKKTDQNGVCRFIAIELHVSAALESASDDKQRATHRVFSHQGIIDKDVVMDGKQHTRKECRFAYSPDIAEQLYALLCEQQLLEYRQQFALFPAGVGSDKMISNNISSQISHKESLSPSIKSLVHSIWSDAIGELTSLLNVPVERLKLEDIDKAEGILQAIREILDKNGHSLENLKKYSDEFYSLVPHSEKNTKEINTKRVIAEKQDLCQLIKDMLSVSEATNFSTRGSDEAKYKALGCHLQSLSKSTDEYRNIVNRMESTSEGDISVQNIFTCHRPVEAANFQSQFDNVRQLFHSSKAQNFLGILSRGLLLPKLVVSDYGGERSDAGSLGTGIYFGEGASTSIKYSSPGQSRGSRFLLICNVALGKVKDYTQFASDLESAPDGYQSCHGVKNQPENFPTQFKQDEYVVYSVNQQRIRYLVEFTLPGDDVIANVPDASETDGENVLFERTTAISLDEKSESSDEDESIPSITTVDIENVENPLDKVKPGLRFEGDSLVPLQAVHIRAKLLDLCAKVVVMQVYNNSSSKPIEAKYVFPLDDMAAVCGFEAFINGKHIVGEVKEKEQAHKEYKKAISEGHGAYLMDEETPDVFTVSVGNIPPGATVLIKITYVAELPVEDENILFNLPGSLAPWSREEALKDSTQDTVESVKIDYETPLELSVHIAVEMPFDIRTLTSPTHQVKIKKTATKAVIQMESDQSLANGLQLLIGLAEIHVPRMWAERDRNNSDSQACMLSFYPEFEAEPMENIEYVFLLDISCSMKGSSLENAKKILLLALNELPAGSRFNIVAFGSHWLELFPSSAQKSQKSLKDATAFIKRFNGDMGATDIWKVLKALSLLPVKDDVHVRNVCILSDGHVTEEELSVRLASNNEEKSRIFTFGVGSSANRYFLRTLAKVGAGACEYFDSKVKSKWQRKVESLLTKSQQPVLTSVSVAWQQFDNDAPTPIQAPSQILSLFNGSRLVVYGFVPYCTQATLKAKINGKEISTVVSTSELSITSGTTLHQLTARALINDWEEGLLAPDHLHHQALKISRKDYIIEISKKYSVTSKFTSFVAIEKREEGETFDSTSAPDIEEILAVENVDILGYIGWSEDDTEGLSEELYAREADAALSSESDDAMMGLFNDDSGSAALSSESDDAMMGLFDDDCGSAGFALTLGRNSVRISCAMDIRNTSALRSESEASSCESEASSCESDDAMGLFDDSGSAGRKSVRISGAMDLRNSSELEPRDLSSIDSLRLSTNQLFGSSRPASQLPSLSEFSSDGLFAASLPQTVASDSSTLSRNQLFGSSAPAAQDTAPLGSLGFGSSLPLPAHENRARHFCFSVDPILADEGVPQTSMMPKKVKKKKGSALGIEPPDFFSSMITVDDESTAQFDNITVKRHSSGSNLKKRGEDRMEEKTLGFSFDLFQEQPEQLQPQQQKQQQQQLQQQKQSLEQQQQQQQQQHERQQEELFEEKEELSEGEEVMECRKSTKELRRSSSVTKPKSTSTVVQEPREIEFSFADSSSAPPLPPPPPSSAFYDIPVTTRAPATLRSCRRSREESLTTLQDEKKPEEYYSEVYNKFLLPRGVKTPSLPSPPAAGSTSIRPTPSPRKSQVAAIVTDESLLVPCGISSIQKSPLKIPPPLPPKLLPSPSNSQESVSTDVPLPPPLPPRRHRASSPVTPKSLRKPAVESKLNQSPVLRRAVKLGALPTVAKQTNKSTVSPEPVTLASDIYLGPSSRLGQVMVTRASEPQTESTRPRKLLGKVKKRSLPCSEGERINRSYSEGERSCIINIIEKKESCTRERGYTYGRERSAVITRMSMEESLFQLQNEDGSWSLPDSRLDEYIQIKTETIEKLLIECGAKSLGTRIFSMLCKMLATLLVLVYLRYYKPSSCPASFIPPFKIRESFEGPEIEWHAKVAKALTWLKTADKLVPCVCTRLQLGNNWEEVIPKLLGFESPIQV